jgi:hypothetical protein
MTDGKKPPGQGPNPSPSEPEKDKNKEPEIPHLVKLKVEYDKYSHSIKIKDSTLLMVVSLEGFTKHMHAFHANGVEKIIARAAAKAHVIVRSKHLQLASIVRQYVPVYEVEAKDISESLKVGLEEAALIEKHCVTVMSEVQAEQDRGNVSFVDKLSAVSTVKKAWE